MLKEHVEGRLEETIGEVTEVPGKVVGNKAVEQAGAAQKNGGNYQAVAGDKKSAKSPRALKAQEATALLRRNHQIVSDLFDEYETLDLKSRKKSLLSRICVDLTIHAQVKEEIFYPALNEILKDKRLVSKAIGEHAALKALIVEVEGVKPDGEDFDAKVMVLSEYVKHHVREEQNQMFPRATATKLDMMALGARIASRKAELVAVRARRA